MFVMIKYAESNQIKSIRFVAPLFVSNNVKNIYINNNYSWLIILQQANTLLNLIVVFHVYLYYSKIMFA